MKHNRRTWKEGLLGSLGVIVCISFFPIYHQIREHMPVGKSIETCWRFPDECNKLHPVEYQKQVIWMLGNCVRSLWPHPEDCETRFPSEFQTLYEDAKREVKAEVDADSKACVVLEKTTQGRQLCDPGSDELDLDR
jgi:hypothetical protein